VCWDPNTGLLEAVCPSCHGKLAQHGKSSTESYKEGISLKHLKKTQNPPNKKRPPKVVLSALERVNLGLEWKKIMNPLTTVSISVSQITFLSLTQTLKAFYGSIPMTQAFIILSLHKSCC